MLNENLLLFYIEIKAVVGQVFIKQKIKKGTGGEDTAKYKDTRLIRYKKLKNQTR